MIKLNKFVVNKRYFVWKKFGLKENKISNKHKFCRTVQKLVVWKFFLYI